MKTAIVTGAASGLGLELCRALASRQYRIAMFSRDMARLQREASTLGTEATVVAFQGDVTDAERVHESVAKVEATWGPIDIAVANAGIRSPTWAENFSLDAAGRLMDTNYFGMLNLFHAVVPGMLNRKGGCFVGIASLAGIRCLPGGAGYAGSKAAMQAFLDTVRLELEPRGVQVVTVNPWFIRTPAKDDGVPRPLMVEADWAANKIVHGIEAGKSQIDFPLLPSLAWKVVRMLPNSMFVRLFGHRAGRASVGMRMLSFAGRRLGKATAPHRQKAGD